MLDSLLVSDIKKFVNYLLLPLEEYYYHQYSHSLDVMERSLYLAEKENVNWEDKELLAIASLFHDTGFVIQYDDNEYIGAKIARNYLKTNLYPEEKIRKIEGLILATAPSHEPQDILEKIIKDADLDNLGRNDFFDTAQKVQKEIETIKNIKMKDPEWEHALVQLLKGNKFYTETQRRERQWLREENAKKIENNFKQ